MDAPEPDIGRVAALLERLIADPAFRASFRRDPDTACQAYGLPQLAPEVRSRTRALHTLEIRESRSSLAGIIAALAVEAADALQLFGEVAHHPDTPAAQAMHQALTRLNMRAVHRHPLGVVPEPPRPASPDASYWNASSSAGRRVAASVAEHHDHGGRVLATARALLDDPRFSAWDSARRDLRNGVADPRIVAILGRLGERHGIAVSVIKSGHTKLVAGTSNVSNHFYGRAVDIAAVDGRSVSAGNAAARKVVDELAALPKTLAPSEVGSPWDLPGPVFWTNSAHQNHIHIGFRDPPPANLKLDASVAAPPLTASPAREPVARSAAAASGVFAAVGAPRGRAQGTIGILAAVADRRPPAQGDAVAQLAPAPDQPTPYPGDRAPRAALAHWLGAQASKAGLPQELPVMAALVESNLTNAHYGDRDSLGFFQMRTGTWDRGAYAGYPHRPELQARWFIDQALAVRKAWIADRHGDPARDPQQWGQWIADIEQPATQYRGRYQPKLGLARRLLHDSGDAAGAHLAAAGAPDRLIAGGSARAAHAVELALRYRGTPYVYGGESPSGFDCSGLNQYVYARVGIHLPRVAAAQAHAGSAVPRQHLAPGDLVFFANSSGYIHHTGISLGGDKFVHAPHTGDVVKVSSLGEPYYHQQFAGARRVARPLAGERPPPVPKSTPSQPVAGSVAAVSGVFAAVGAPRGRAQGTIGILAAVADRRPPAQGDALAQLAPTPDEPTGYPGDGAPRAALAHWLAARAGKAGLPQELPVMAALVESGLTNADHGDRDSLGFFQMRTSIWDRGAYAGYPHRPELQARWFVDQAVRVRNDWLAAGRGDPARDPQHWGQWIADIERPAAQYRGRYQPQLGPARRLLGRL